MKYLIISLIIFFSVPAFTQSQNSNTWTLRECIDYAINNNVNVKLGLLETDLANIDKREAQGNFLPTASANASHSWAIGLNQNITTGILENQTTQFSALGFSIGANLFNGLQNQNLLRRSAMALIANQYQVTQIREDIALNVANAYLQILFNKENLKIQQEQLKNNLIQKNRVTELVEGGMLARGELIDLEATIAADQQRVIQAENALILSKLGLIQLLQLDQFEDFDVSDDISGLEFTDVLEYGPADIFARSRKNRTEILLAEQNIDIAAIDIKIAEGARLPRLAAFYNINTRIAYLDQITGFNIDGENPVRTIGFVENTNQNVLTVNTIPVIGDPDPFFMQFSNNLGHNFGLSLQVPIFTGYQIRNNIDRAKVALERARLVHEQEDINLQRNVYTAYYDALGAKNAYEAAQIALKARELSVEYATERLEVGAINTFDYSNVQTLYINAQSEILRTKYDYLFRLKILEFYFGIPLIDPAD